MGPEVDVDGELPILKGRVGDRLLSLGGGVVDEHVDLPVGVDGSFDERLDGRRVGEISCDRGRLAALLLDGGDDLPGAVFVAPRYDDVRPPQWQTVPLSTGRFRSLTLSQALYRPGNGPR